VCRDVRVYDCCGNWVCPNSEPGDWEESWEPAPVSSSQELRILGPMRALVSLSDSILVLLLLCL
jgi:hypothetical protein